MDTMIREFKKYQHLEKFGSDEVEDIEFGTTFIFPKIDGTNGAVWLSEGKIQTASRNRVLSLANDNQGFCAYITQNERLFKAYFHKYPNTRLYGEWLVPHSLKTYRDNAWRLFYIFDVSIDDPEREHTRHLSYDEYQPMLEEFQLDYISPLVIMENPNQDSLFKALEKNQFLIKDGAGIGEGIVIKNYSFVNKYGRQTWAKIVTTEFKEKHVRAMGATNLLAKQLPEEIIAEQYCTEALIEKTFAKIKNDENGWNSKLIPRLLNTVYHDLINEEIWNILKDLKNPTIDFLRLQKIVNNKIKTVLKTVF